MGNRRSFQTWMNLITVGYVGLLVWVVWSLRGFHVTYHDGIGPFGLGSFLFARKRRQVFAVRSSGCAGLTLPRRGFESAIIALHLLRLRSSEAPLERV